MTLTNTIHIVNIPVYVELIQPTIVTIEGGIEIKSSIPLKVDSKIK